MSKRGTVLKPKKSKKPGRRSISASAETLHAVMSLTMQGMGRDRIAKEVGRSPNTVRSWVNDFNAGVLTFADGGVAYGDLFIPFAPKAIQQALPDQAIAMENARLRAENEILKTRAVISRPDISPIMDSVLADEALPAQLWRAAEIENEVRCAQAQYEGQFNASLGSGPVAVTFVADQHIANGEPTDLVRMREDAELIAVTDGMFAILGGDGIQNHIKHRAAVVNSRSTPKDQYKLYNHYLGLLAPKILALISGNHDNWTKQTAGVDVVQMLADQNKIFYTPDRAYVNAQVGAENYMLAIRHQYRFNSSTNQTNTVKRWWDMGEVNFDIGVICHHHEASIEPFDRHGITRWAARPGSYQITSAYSRQYGFNLTRPTCPTFILYGDRRHIVGFNDVRDAVKFLNVERSQFSMGVAV